MRIGIDISQVIYQGTGVARYVRSMVESVIRQSTQHDFMLFGASLRRTDELSEFIRQMHNMNDRVTGVILTVPPTLLDFLWNRLHIFPVERFTGPLDVFWSSDWTQPPLVKAAGVTTIHDVAIYRYPRSFPRQIVAVQKRRLKRAVRECSMFICDSEATRKDVMELLHLPPEQVVTVYPGYSV